MTEGAMKKHRGHRWFAFWENLHEGYMHFERSGLPPDVGVRDKQYTFTEGARPL